jgi:hypothetical protein
MDLDGLILDTESLCMEVGRQVLAKHGKASEMLGLRPRWLGARVQDLGRLQQALGS